MSTNTQTIADNLPAIAGGISQLPPPMCPIFAFVSLSVGLVADAPYLIASGDNLLAEMGLSEFEQFSVRGLLVAALCFVFKLLLSYHRDAMRRQDDEKKQLRQERDEALKLIRKLNEERIKQLEGNGL